MANYKIIIPVFLFFVAAILMFISFKASENSDAVTSTPTTEVASTNTANTTPRNNESLDAKDSTSNTASAKRTKFTLPKRRTKNDPATSDATEPTDFETQATDSSQEFAASDDAAQQNGDSDFGLSDDLELGLSDDAADDKSEVVDGTGLLRDIEAQAPQQTETAPKETFASLSESADKSLLSDLVESEDLDSEGRFETTLDGELEGWGRDNDVAVEPTSSALRRTEVAKTEAATRTEAARTEIARTEVVRETTNRAPRFGLQAPPVVEKKTAANKTKNATTNERIAERKPRSSRPSAPQTRPLDSTTRTVSSAVRPSTDENTQISIRNSTKLPVAFLFNGTLRRLAPGQDFEATTKGEQNRIRFDRGGSYGALNKQLKPQRYEFRVSHEGWKLVPRESSKN